VSPIYQDEYKQAAKTGTGSYLGSAKTACPIGVPLWVQSYSSILI